ncbi:MAG: hypothetical protein ACJ780_17580 [Solirubrobacteraceae bacterium]|jgi:hypothetical protein
MTEGCPRCGRGTEARPHRSGRAWLALHEVRCWGPKTALYNVVWLWTHPADAEDGDDRSSTTDE